MFLMASLIKSSSFQWFCSISNVDDIFLFLWHLKCCPCYTAPCCFNNFSRFSVIQVLSKFLQDVDNSLLQKAFLDLRKKEMLHKKWSERIAEPVEAKIYEEMKKNYPQVDNQKRKLYQEYLQHGNRKVGLQILHDFSHNSYGW